jgi:hypothetical protein
VLPTGETPEHGEMQFTLRGWDRVEGTTIAPGPLTVPVTAGGAFEIDLQSSTETERGVVYDAVLTYWAEGKQRVVGFPPIGVPATGPVPFGVLLTHPAPEPNAPEILAQILALSIQAGLDANRAETARDEAAEDLAATRALVSVPSWRALVGTGDGVATVFTLPAPVAVTEHLTIWFDGLTQHGGFSVSGASLTFDEPPLPTVEIRAEAKPG